MPPTPHWGQLFHLISHPSPEVDQSWEVSSEVEVRERIGETSQDGSDNVCEKHIFWVWIILRIAVIVFLEMIVLEFHRQPEQLPHHEILVVFLSANSQPFQR